MEHNVHDKYPLKRKFSIMDCTVTDPVPKRVSVMNDASTLAETTSRSFSLIPVLSDEYERRMETELMYIGKVTKKGEISRLVKELSQTWPLGNKPYLKRVRRTTEEGVFEMILCPVSDIVIEDSQINTVHKLEQIIGTARISTNGLSDCVTKCSVPKFPPLTREQYEESIKFWPVQFHEDKYIAKILSNQLFSIQEKEEMWKYMKLAVEVAKYGEVQVGAVIVNPVSKEVIATAHDNRHQHPLQHAVMLAVDLVARSQGGGSWTVNSENVSYASNIKTCTDGVAKSSLPYLCTSYDLYVTREPCIMCAMALVHSRIRRVFVGNSTPWGALGTHYKLHAQPGLNHHYEVWKGLMEHECQFLKTEDTKSLKFDS